MMRTIYFAHDQQESPEQRKHFLELAGYAVQLFATYADADGALTSDPSPSLVLIDALLEGKNGFEARATSRSRYAGRNFPIVLVLAHLPHAARSATRPCSAAPRTTSSCRWLPTSSCARVNQAIGYFVPPGAQKSAAA